LGRGPTTVVDDGVVNAIQYVKSQSLAKCGSDCEYALQFLYPSQNVGACYVSAFAYKK
jgi:hypothetical protein